MNTKTASNSKTPGPLLKIPDGSSEEIEPGRLLLDPANLRLLEAADESLGKVAVRLIGQPAVQKRIFDIVANDKSFQINSLVDSISYNGFLKHERLIVCRYDATQFIVLEGNRRVTAVRMLLEKQSRADHGLPDYVMQSLRTLPCFVLDGAPVGSDAARLIEYRKAAEVYIGMRHLMGAKSWEPASRYEFQARLIQDEGWTPEDVATRFGRTKTEVLRDLKAQVLYNDFRKIETKSSTRHTMTYNAFSEAARAPAIVKWLGWSNAKGVFLEKENEKAFFDYLRARMWSRATVGAVEGEEETPQESAELVVRRLREMLKLDDEAIKETLIDRAFDVTDMLFEQKREGTFAKRVASYTRGLKNVTIDELRANVKENTVKVKELAAQAEATVSLLQAIAKK